MPRIDMVRINTSSIFETVDLDDAASLRRIMNALHYLLTNTVLYSAAPELKAIQGEGRQQENSVTQIILSRIRMMPNHLLLLKATLRFIDARDGTDQQVLNAAKELETLGAGKVLISPQAHPAAYVAAEALFSSRPRQVSNYMPIYMFNRSLEEKVRMRLDAYRC